MGKLAEGSRSGREEWHADGKGGLGGTPVADRQSPATPCWRDTGANESRRHCRSAEVSQKREYWVQGTDPAACEAAI